MAIYPHDHGLILVVDHGQTITICEITLMTMSMSMCNHHQLTLMTMPKF